MTFEFYIEQPIQTKKNLIMFGKGRFYRGEDWYDFENESVLLLKNQLQNLLSSVELYTFPLEVVHSVNILFTVKKNNRDLDNMISTVFDLLQKAGIVSNDKIIDNLTASKYKEDKDYTKISVEVW